MPLNLHKMKKYILSTLIIISTLFLNGCLLTSAISIGTAIVASSDRRTAGEILDDKNISLSLLAWSAEDDNKIKDAHLNYMVYDAEVLVTGEVPNEEVRDYITKQIPLKDFKVSRVINELRVAPNSELLSRVKDSTITAQIETLFLNQEVFNPIHIRVTTENRSVYLMGKATSREVNKATKIASKADGVKRVVKLFQYLKTRPAAELQREKEKKLQAEEEAKLAKKRELIEAKKAELRRQLKALDSNSGTNFSP